MVPLSLLLAPVVAGLLGPDGPRHKGTDGFLPPSATGLTAAPARYQMNRSTIIMPCNDSG